MVECLFMDAVDGLCLVSVHGDVTVHGYILLPGTQNASSHLQLLYVNGHSVESLEISEMVMHLYETVTRGNTRTMPCKAGYVLQLDIHPEVFDLKVDGDKKVVIFEDSESIIAAVQLGIIEAWKSRLPHYMSVKLEERWMKQQEQRNTECHPFHETEIMGGVRCRSTGKLNHGNENGFKRKSNDWIHPLMTSKRRSVMEAVQGNQEDRDHPSPDARDTVHMTSFPSPTCSPLQDGCSENNSDNVCPVLNGQQSYRWRSSDRRAPESRCTDAPASCSIHGWRQLLLDQRLNAVLQGNKAEGPSVSSADRYSTEHRQFSTELCPSGCWVDDDNEEKIQHSAVESDDSPVSICEGDPQLLHSPTPDYLNKFPRQEMDVLDDDDTDSDPVYSDMNQVCYSAPPIYRPNRRSIHRNPPCSLKSNTIIQKPSKATHSPNGTPLQSHHMDTVAMQSMVIPMFQSDSNPLNMDVLVPIQRFRRHNGEQRVLSLISDTSQWTLNGSLNQMPLLDITNANQASPTALHRRMLQSPDIIGQFDRKFILIRSHNVILAIDQHAADERIRLEALESQIEAQLKTHTPFSQQCTHAIDIKLTPYEQEIFKAHQSQLGIWGWKGRLDQATGTLILTHVPHILNTHFTAIDLKGYLYALEEQLGAVHYPPCLTRLLKSKACRSAVMFGDVLTTEQQRQCVEGLSQTQLCFICAHGRPTVAILLSMDDINGIIKN